MPPNPAPLPSPAAPARSWRPRLGPSAVLLLTALWIASVGNLALWRAMGQLPELGDARGLAFRLAFGVIIAALHVLLFSLIAWRGLLKPVLTLFLLAAAVGGYFMLSYGVAIDRTMMVNVLLTDTREARELLSLRMAGMLLALGALPVALLWSVRIVWPTALRQLRANAVLLVAAFVVAVGATGIFFQDMASTMRNHTQLRYLMNPLNSFYALATVGLQPVQHNGGAVLPLGRDAKLAPPAPGALPPLLVFVVGETARADHFALNGYPRPTTPELAARGVVSMRDAWSCGTNTAASVPCMFSPLGRQAFDKRPDNTEGLADVLQHAGYAVLWIDNQAGGCKGACDRVPTVHYDQLQAPDLCGQDGECYDEAMLRGLQERIDQLPPERRARGVALFMHQMGSHGPAYYRRSPPAFKKFLPECATNALQQCSHEQLLNSFDNTIAYTDHFLASVIDWLQQRQQQWAPALVYVSDHGESLGENNLYLHGMPYRWAPDVQKHVPWIFWLSPPYQRQTGITAACLEQRKDEKISHDNYFHTAIGMLGVQTGVYDPARDLTAVCRQPAN